MRSAVILCMAFLVGCQSANTGPRLSRRASPEAEALAGARRAPALEARFGGVLSNRDAEERMERIGQRVCRHSPGVQGSYRYHLLDTDEINAFSLPGGLIYVTRGLYSVLDEDQQLAAVIAHEMAHIESRDHFAPRAGSTDTALDRELSADARAVTLLDEAGISPWAMADVVAIIQEAQPTGWSNIRMASIARASNHPPTPLVLAETRP